MSLSVAIVVFNEEKNLPRVLASLSTAPPFPFEILVVNNLSSDFTEAAFRRFQDTHPALPLRWVSRDTNNLGAARELALQEAKYSVVAFLDADCLAPPGWMEKSYRALMARESDPLVLGVGSGNFPPRNGDLFNQAASVVFSSVLGHMNSPQLRVSKELREVRHLPTCNVFYFRERALAVGFSDHFPRVGEDLDFSWRAYKAGYKFFSAPGNEVIHTLRPSWLEWIKKMFRYGYAQLDIAFLHPAHLAGTKALPLIAVAVAALLLALSVRVFFLVLLLYLGLLGVYSFGLAVGRRKLVLMPRIFLFFLTIHIFYSLGELWGIGRQIGNRKVQQRKGK